MSATGFRGDSVTIFHNACLKKEIAESTRGNFSKVGCSAACDGLTGVLFWILSLYYVCMCVVVEWSRVLLGGILDVFLGW